MCGGVGWSDLPELLMCGGVGWSDLPELLMCGGVGWSDLMVGRMIIYNR
jgi:hypothetical protein